MPAPDTTTDAGASGRPMDAARTQQILDVTWQIVTESGFAAVDVQAIARRVGCAKSTIYRRWPTKAALIAAALTDTAEVGADPDTGDVCADLVEFALVNVRNQARRLSALVLAADREVGEALWAGLLGQRQALVIGILDRAVARGQLPADTDLMAVIDLLSGFTVYRVAARQDPPTRAVLHRIVTAIVRSPPRRPSSTAPEGE